MQSEQLFLVLWSVLAFWVLGQIWLCQIVMFLLLGLLVTPDTLLDYALPGILLALVLTFVARPLAVLVTSTERPSFWFATHRTSACS